MRGRFWRGVVVSGPCGRSGLHVRFGRAWLRCRYRTSRRKDFDLRRRPAWPTAGRRTRYFQLSLVARTNAHRCDRDLAQRRRPFQRRAGIVAAIFGRSDLCFAGDVQSQHAGTRCAASGGQAIRRADARNLGRRSAGQRRRFAARNSSSAARRHGQHRKCRQHFAVDRVARPSIFDDGRSRSARHGSSLSPTRRCRSTLRWFRITAARRQRRRCSPPGAAHIGP